MTGICRYCGQTMMVETDDESFANELATQECKCDEGREYRNIEEMKVEAKDNAKALFGEELPFPDEVEQLKNDVLLHTMNIIIDSMAAGIIKKCSLKLSERVTASLIRTKDDGIKIKKNYKEEYSLEANKY